MNERDDGHDLFGDMTRGSANDSGPGDSNAGTRPAARHVARQDAPKAEARAEPQPDLFGFAAPVPTPASKSATKSATQRPARVKRDDDAEIEAREDGEPLAKPPTKPTRNPDAPKRRGRGVLPAVATQDTLFIAAALPASVRLGTSSWSFPGWRGIVYGEDYSQSKLARDGLSAYGAHPLLRSVSIDRSFYAPLTVTDYLRYAQQVPDHFRFIVKAPALVTDASVRGERGEPVSANPCFLNAELAAREFVEPCLAGLGSKAGALVFQFPPLPDQLLADPAAFVERLTAFLAALPPLPKPPESSAAGDGPCYAIEIRDAILLTPRFVRTLRAAGVRYCVGLHARMQDPLRQAAALALMDGEAPAGPLI